MILKGVKDKIDVKVTAEIETDNGRTIQVPFMATFKKLNSEDRALARLRFFGENDDDDNVIKEALSTEDLMDEYLLGWSNVPTETGEPFEYTPENLAEMLSAPEYADALYRGAYCAAFGKAALKKILSILGRSGR